MMEKHIDAAEIIGGDVDFLAVEGYRLGFVAAEYLGKLEQQ